ncbi:aminotransferase class I and II domain-containing protein [Phthorimaea operculella]|nr:aminotransferase class I and II domain-containing protein [Phthorimaea operculella]
MFRSRPVLLAALKSADRSLERKSHKVIARSLVSSCDMNDKFKLPARYGDGAKSVWVEYIHLAAEYKPAVNLGQGFPDYHAPKHVTNALAEIATGDNPLLHQYTRGFGHPRLVQNLAKLYSPLIGRELNPMTEILVTSGAYEALFSAILGHVDTGDEVIVIEPFFDCYDYMITQAGGISKFIALKPKTKPGETLTSADWVLDEAELASLFNSKTKMIILNTPHNPLGKIFTRKELELIADLCKKHNVLCISDEVYEWMVFEPHQHIRIATLPGMWERTITIGSAGKTFSVTGWKTGWAYCPASLMQNLQVVHQNCVYTHSTPVQADMHMLASYNHRFSRQDVLGDRLEDWVGVLPRQPHAELASGASELRLHTQHASTGSAGKTFSVTGWKTGWACCPASLMQNLQVVHQNCVYTHSTPVQEAVARAFEIELSRRDSPECYMKAISKELLPKRDYLVKVLRENGFNPTVPDGGYFVVADWTSLQNKIDLSGEPDKWLDYKFTKKFAKEAGVLAIPPSAFYSEGHKKLGENYARFCFIKKDENLQLAEKLIKEWNAKKKQ